MKLLKNIVPSLLYILRRTSIRPSFTSPTPPPPNPAPILKQYFSTNLSVTTGGGGTIICPHCRFFVANNYGELREHIKLEHENEDRNLGKKGERNFIRTPTDEKYLWKKQKYEQQALEMTLHEDCKLSLLEIKAKTHRFIVLKIDEKLKQVMVEKIGDHSQTYANFISCLPVKECRYAIFNYDSYIKIFFWCPETSRLRSKLIYGCSKYIFKKELELQGTGAGLDIIELNGKE